MMNKLFKFLIELFQKNWIIGIIAFVIISIISLLEPINPVKDENYMIYEIYKFSQLGFWGHIQNIKTQQGPLFYYIMGLLMKIFDLNLTDLRIINCVVSALFIVVILKIFQLQKTNKFYTFLVFLNPYFLMLTAPLIYNDNLPLLCLFTGFLCYLKEKHFISIIFFSMACLMRQNLIFAPAAIFFVEVLLSYKKIEWNKIIYLVPVLVLFTLFYIWGGRLSSPSLYKNLAFITTIKGFNFNIFEIIKAIEYQLILLSIFALPQIILSFKYDKKLLWLMFTVVILFSVFPPTHINFKFHQYLSMYNYGGYLDQFLSKFYWFAIPLSGILVATFLNQFKTFNLFKYSKIQLIILVFIFLNLLFYSLTPFWDKYYVMMGVFIPLLLSDNVKLENKSTLANNHPSLLKT